MLVIGRMRKTYIIILTIRDAYLAGHKMLLTREYECPINGNEIIIKDTVENIGSAKAPYMILYHFNMGYPLLTENSVVSINNKGVVPRTECAAKGIDQALMMEKPQAGYKEQCFYYDMLEGKAQISNSDINTKLSINYNVDELPYFTQWKMMGMGEYVLGLEPGNCITDGRNIMREKGELVFLEPGEKKSQKIVIKISHM